MQKGKWRQGTRRRLKEEASCIMDMYPFPKETVKCMYHILIKFLKDYSINKPIYT